MFEHTGPRGAQNTSRILVAEPIPDQSENLGQGSLLEPENPANLERTPEIQNDDENIRFINDNYEQLEPQARWVQIT